MSVRLSLRRELSSDWMDFHEMLYLNFFGRGGEYVEKVRVSLKSNKRITGTVHENRYTLMVISHSVLLTIRIVSD